MPDNHPMPALFAGTQDVSDALKARGVEVVDIEAHDANDPDSCDRIWLSRYADGGTREGEYVFVGQTQYRDSDRVDLWVGHNCADAYGGHPTNWSSHIEAGDSDAIQALILEHWPEVATCRSFCPCCEEVHHQVPKGMVGGTQCNGCDVDFTTWCCSGCGLSWTGELLDPEDS